MFPRLPPRATFIADTKFVPRHINVSDFFQKHFVATNVSRFARHINNARDGRFYTRDAVRLRASAKIL